MRTQTGGPDPALSSLPSLSASPFSSPPAGPSHLSTFFLDWAHGLLHISRSVLFADPACSLLAHSFLSAGYTLAQGELVLEPCVL